MLSLMREHAKQMLQSFAVQIGYPLSYALILDDQGQLDDLMEPDDYEEWAYWREEYRAES